MQKDKVDLIARQAKARIELFCSEYLGVDFFDECNPANDEEINIPAGLEADVFNLLASLHENFEEVRKELYRNEMH